MSEGTVSCDDPRAVSGIRPDEGSPTGVMDTVLSMLYSFFGRRGDGDLWRSACRVYQMQLHSRRQRQTRPTRQLNNGPRENRTQKESYLLLAAGR
jgi:hypothetical protein